MENVWSFRFKEMGSSSRNSFLVEASGDSDQLNLLDTNNNFDHQHLSSVNDDDDAGSCSCDVSDQYYSSVSNGYDQFEKFESDQEESSSVHHVLCKGSDEEEEEEEDEVLQKIHDLKRWGDSRKLKSCVSVESNINEPINEKEENRLFWEACLAS